MARHEIYTYSQMHENVMNMSSVKEWFHSFCVHSFSSSSFPNNPPAQLSDIDTQITDHYHNNSCHYTNESTSLHWGKPCVHGSMSCYLRSSMKYRGIREEFGSRGLEMGRPVAIKTDSCKLMEGKIKKDFLPLMPAIYIAHIRTFCRAP